MSETREVYLLSPNGSLSLSEQDEPKPLLTRQQLAEALGTSDAKIRRYAEADTTNEYFGGIAGLGKGVRYPAEAVPLFREAMTLTPALFQRRVVEALAARANSPTPNGALSLSESRALVPAETQRLIETIRIGFTEFQQSLEGSLQSVPINVVAYAYADKMLTLKEAREETGLTIAEIRRVPAVQSHIGGRKRWRRSDLQKLIASMSVK